jgi:hypothetical protein
MKKQTRPNRSKSIGQDYTNELHSDSREQFVAVVRAMVERDSPLLQSFGERFMDNRHAFFVTPIDSNSDNTYTIAYFMNGSHGMDLPLPNEAVMCVNINSNIFIVDRLSVYAYGVNDDNSVHLLSKIGTYDPKAKITEIRNDFNSFKKESINTVVPWFFKQGCYYKIGRNNQFLIFDAGSRSQRSSKETDETTDGKYIKMGFKEGDKDYESGRNPSSIIISKDAPIFSLFSSKVNSSVIDENKTSSQNGIGIQTDDVLFIGRRSVTLFSPEKLLLKSNRIFLEAETSVNVTSPRINLGNAEVNAPIAKAEPIAEALSDLASILQTLVSTPTPPVGAPLNPLLINQIVTFVNKYTLKPTTPISSKEVFVK